MQGGSRQARQSRLLPVFSQSLLIALSWLSSSVECCETARPMRFWSCRAEPLTSQCSGLPPFSYWAAATCFPSDVLTGRSSASEESFPAWHTIPPKVQYAGLLRQSLNVTVCNENTLQGSTVPKKLGLPDKIRSHACNFLLMNSCVFLGARGM